MTAIDQRLERVRLETPRLRITGEVTLARDGYRSRVSDLLNAPERDFITLTHAVVEALDGGVEPEHHEFIAVARRHVVYAVSLRRDE